MGVTLITGHSGAGHITSADAGRLIAGVVGLDRYVLPTGKKFAYTIISNNEIDIADGDLVDQGRHITLPQNEIEVVQIENGTQNMERIDTIAIKYTMDATSGIESASMVLKKGTPVAIGSGTAAPATLTTGNIYAGATEDETALYYVYISGITITKVVQSFVVRESLAVLKNDITALNNGLANKAEKSDLTTLQNAFRNIWAPKSLPSGFNSTDRYSMSTLENGFYWHYEHDGTLNFPNANGFMFKFGYETNGWDFNALYYTQDAGPIYRISGNGLRISGWVQI